MLLKTIIVLLLIGLIISLASGFVFLFKDIGTTKKRTLYALGIRVSLATALVGTIVFGFLTGQLGVGAPWDARKFEQQNAQANFSDTPTDNKASEAK